MGTRDETRVITWEKTREETRVIACEETGEPIITLIQTDPSLILKEMAEKL